MLKQVRKLIHELLSALLPNYRLGTRLLEPHKFLLEGAVLARLDVPDGIFYIDTQSKLISCAFNGVYEIHIDKYLKKVILEDIDIIVNIGANIGFYTVSLANHFKKNSIIGIEPNPEAYLLLQKNVTINGLNERVTVYNSCVSDKICEVRFNYIKGKSEFSSLNKIIPEYGGNSIQLTKVISSFPLNHFVGDNKVGLILMDVEGAENLVLDGALELIKSDRPVIIMECADKLLSSFNSSSSKVISLLKSLDYSVLTLDNSSSAFSSSYNGTILAYNKTKLHFQF
jgi:FkbM family methyltransferase